MEGGWRGCNMWWLLPVGIAWWWTDYTLLDAVDDDDNDGDAEDDDDYDYDDYDVDHNELVDMIH